MWKSVDVCMHGCEWAALLTAMPVVTNVRRFIYNSLSILHVLRKLAVAQAWHFKRWDHRKVLLIFFLYFRFICNACEVKVNLVHLSAYLKYSTSHMFNSQLAKENYIFLFSFNRCQIKSCFSDVDEIWWNGVEWAKNQQVKRSESRCGSVSLKTS